MYFFNLPKFLNRKKINEEFSKDDEIEARITEKLLEEKPLEPVQSVTENSTKLLFVENETHKIK